MLAVSELTICLIVAVDTGTVGLVTGSGFANLSNWLRHDMSVGSTLVPFSSQAKTPSRFGFVKSPRALQRCRRIALSRFAAMSWAGVSRISSTLSCSTGVSGSGTRGSTGPVARSGITNSVMATAAHATRPPQRSGFVGNGFRGAGFRMGGLGGPRGSRISV